MKTPKRLYEALPWLYIAAGLAVIVALRNWLAFISGSMLLLTGAVVLTLRARFRRPVHDDADALRRPGGPSESAAAATAHAMRQPSPGDLARLASQRAQARARARREDEMNV